MTSLSLYCSQNERLRLQHELEAGEKASLAQSGWLRTLRGTTSLLGGGGDLRRWLGENSPLLVLIPYEGAFNPTIPKDNAWAQRAATAFTALSSVFQDIGHSDQPVYYEATQHLINCLAQVTVAQNALALGHTNISGGDDGKSRISARPSS